MRNIVMVLGLVVKAATAFVENIRTGCQLEGDNNRVNLKGSTNKCKKWIVPVTYCATLHILLLIPLLWSQGLCRLQSALHRCSLTETSLVVWPSHLSEAGVSGHHTIGTRTVLRHGQLTVWGSWHLWGHIWPVGWKSMDTFLFSPSGRQLWAAI